MPRRIQFEGRILEFPDDATDDEIRSSLGTTEPPRPPSFGVRLWEGINPVPVLKAALSPIETAKAMYRQPGIRGMQAFEAAKRGELSLAAGRAMQAIPILGGAAEIGEKMAEDIRAGNLPGAAGTMASIAAPSAIAKVAPLLPIKGTRLASAAEKQYSQALGATQRTMKYLSNKVVPTLLKDRVWAFSREGLLRKAGSNLAQTADELETAYDALPPGTQVKIMPILAGIGKKKQKYVLPNGNIGNEVAYQNLQHLQKVIVKKLGPLESSVEDVRKFRQLLDEEVAEAGGYFGKTLKEGSLIKAKRESANAIRNELAKQFPDIAAINKRFNFWNNVQDILTETIQRTKPQSTPMSQQIGRLGGAAIGATGGIPSGIAGTIIGKKVVEMISSPGWRMISAVQKQRLADLLATGKTAAAERMAIVMLANVAVKPSMEPSQTSTEAPSPPFEVAPEAESSPENIKRMVLDEAKEQGLDPGMAVALAESESSFRHILEPNEKGAVGVFQLTPAASADVGVDQFDLKQNIQGGVRYLKMLKDKYGNWMDALTAYKGGMGNLNAGKAMTEAKRLARMVLATRERWRQTEDALKTAGRSAGTH